jgi:C-terminal processing protease CtpA/Prc
MAWKQSLTSNFIPFMEPTMRKLSLSILSFFAVWGCGRSSIPSDSALKVLPLSAEEKRVDIDVAISNFKNFYAPLRYKEEKFGIDFDKRFEQIRSDALATKTDQEFHDVLGRLIGGFKDGHVSITIPDSQTYQLPFVVDYFDDTYVVIQVDPVFAAASGVQVGDELLRMDGVNVRDIAEQLSEFASLGYERSDRRLAALRLTQRTHMLPSQARVFLDFKRHSDGAAFNVATFWSKSPKAPQKAATGAAVSFDMTNTSILEFGLNTPFFYTPEAAAALKFTRVGVSQQQWTAAGYQGSPYDIFALLYRHQGKTILLTRIPSYNVNTEEAQRNVATFKLLLQTYQDFADVLVLDQTHNPGGSVSYVESLAALFLKKPGAGFAFAPRADRSWLRIFAEASQQESSPVAKAYFDGVYSQIEEANERGDFLAPAMSITSITTTIVNNTAWEKPILLLIDELCGSGGDGFPMIMKGNQAATLFGHRTSGLGGNVEAVLPLPHTRAEIKLTRSLFYLARPDGSFPAEAIIENNGVQPDIQRDYGLADFRGRYVQYVKDFSDAAVGLVTKL